MCLLVNFLCRKEEFINWLLMLNGVLMGKYNNSTGAKEKYRDIISILILGLKKALVGGFIRQVMMGTLMPPAKWKGGWVPLLKVFEYSHCKVFWWKITNFVPLEIAVCWQKVSWAGIPPGSDVLELLFSGQGRQGSTAEEQNISSIEHSAGNLNTHY